jgi:hypothetical protein
MKKILFLMSLLFSFSFASGTYDGFDFTDTEEKYTVFFANTATSSEITSIGLSNADYNAIASMRPLPDNNISSLDDSCSKIASNSNITGNDMKRLREWSYRVVIPDHSSYSDINTSLGIPQSQINYLSALSGLLIGFAFAFFLIYSVVNISRNKA